jgi:hypothetical protein
MTLIHDSILTNGYRWDRRSQSHFKNNFLAGTFCKTFETKSYKINYIILVLLCILLTVTITINLFVDRDTDKLKFLENNYQCTVHMHDCQSDALSLKFSISWAKMYKAITHKPAY